MAPALPPEILFDIVELAARPTRSARAVLCALSLVSRDFRELAQALLFRRYSCLKSFEGACNWLGAALSAEAEELKVRFPSPDPRATSATLEQMFARHDMTLKCVFERCASLRRLALHLTRTVSLEVLDHPNLRCVWARCRISKLQLTRVVCSSSRSRAHVRQAAHMA